MGLALGEAFKEERELNADLIRRSLQQSLPPPGAEGELEREYEPELPKSRGGRWVTILLVLILALAVGTAIARWGLPKVGRETSAQAPPAGSVTIVVRARPPAATIEIDGKPVGNRTATLRVTPG